MYNVRGARQGDFKKAPRGSFGPGVTYFLLMLLKTSNLLLVFFLRLRQSAASP
jgi:hypothetical protein